MYARDELIVEDVRVALLQRELIDNQLTTKSNDSPGDGLFARGRSNGKGSNGWSKNKGRSKSRPGNKNKICNYCHIKGHTKAECWKLKKKLLHDSDKGKDKINTRRS